MRTMVNTRMAGDLFGSSEVEHGYLRIIKEATKEREFVYVRLYACTCVGQKRDTKK